MTTSRPIAQKNFYYLVQYNLTVQNEYASTCGGLQAGPTYSSLLYWGLLEAHRPTQRAQHAHVHSLARSPSVADTSGICQVTHV